MKTSKELVESSHEVKITIQNPSENNAKIKKWLEDSNIPARLRGLQDTLSEDIVVLDGSINDASTQTIIHQKKMFFFDVLNEKATLESIIKQSNKNLSTIKDAIKRSYTRFYDLVDVVKDIIQIENDLYQLMDEKGIQENELRQVLIDIFKEQGLTEDQIYNLLDASFKRGYILRERIEAINKKIDDIDDSLRIQIESTKNNAAAILQCKDDIAYIQQAIPTLEQEIAELKEKQEDCATKISVEKKYNQLQSDLSKKIDIEEFQQQLLVEKKEVETLKETTNAEINSLKEEIAVYSLENEKLLDKFKRMIIAFSITSSALLAGLIASFLI